MKKWAHKIELLVDKSIPYLLVALLFIIIGELFFYHQIEMFHIYIVGADYFIIFIFVVDLCFKYNRVRNAPKFLREYWLDILAVFPFFLLFRILDESAIVIARILGISGETWQKFLHIGVETGKLTEETRLMTSIEREEKLLSEIGKGISRSEKFMRFFRPIFRLPRFLRAVDFFEHPKKEIALKEKMR